MITLIAAVAQNGCIGKDGKLPWHIPADLKRFRELTTGHTVIMGRKTWDSIPTKFRPLPNRRNIVLTRNPDLVLPDGVEQFSSLAAALATHTNESIFVIGGAEVYASALPLAQRLELTTVHQVIDGDAFFPAFDTTTWKETQHETHDGYDFIRYER